MVGAAVSESFFPLTDVSLLWNIDAKKVTALLIMYEKGKKILLTHSLHSTSCSRFVLYLQTTCLLRQWRSIVRDSTWPTTWPEGAIIIEAGGPSLNPCTTACRPSGETCTWTCTRPQWSARGSPCRPSTRTESARCWTMLPFTTACTRELLGTCQPPRQPYRPAPDS